MGKTAIILCSKETIYPLTELIVLLVAQVNFSFPNYMCRKSEPFLCDIFGRTCWIFMAFL